MSMNPNTAKRDRGKWLEEAEARTVQANIRTQQADARTDQANARTEDANTRTKQAELQTDWAQLRMGEANVRTGLAENREHTLRASELSYRRLFEAARDGILILDVNTGRISDANPFLVELLGFSHDEMIGKTVGELSPCKDLVSNQAMLNRLQKVRYIRYEDLPLETKDGRHIAVEFVCSVYQAGGVNVIQCNIRDITARKQVETAMIRLAAIVEASTDAIIGKDINGTITSWNRGAANIFGYTAEEIVGSSIMRLIPADRSGEEDEILAQIKRGETVEHFETVRMAKDGRLLDVMVTISPIKDVTGKVTGVSKVAHDITQRKRTERALAASEARFRFLNDLTEATRMLADPRQIMVIMARMLGEHLGASRCAYADVAKDGEQFVILHDYTDGCASTVGDYQLSLFGARPIATLRSGQTLIIRDVDTELLADEGANMFNAIGIKAIVTCPLVKDGRLRAMMAVHQTTPRDWDAGEIAIVQDVVERCWATIERRTAEEKLYQLNAQLELRVIERTAALRTSEARYHLLFDSIDEGFCIIEMIFDAHDQPIDYRFLEVNRSFETHTGLIGVIGKRVRELIPQHETHWYETYGRVSLTGESVRFENQAKELHRWYDVYACRFGESNNHQVAIVFSDITQRKAAEANILRSSQQLQTTNQQLETANKELEAFSYSVSHDLRAPLRAINGFAGIVMNDFATQLPEAARPYLERICSGGKQMGLLIDDLLAFSQLGRQSLKRQHVDTAYLVQSVLQDLASQYEGRQIEIQTGTLPDCWGDPALLKQVWVNLISNAIKYTRERNAALIEIGCVSANGEDIYFVRDNGTGFDMQYAHKLFGVFHRLHLAEKFEGTGVGLAIVQRIVNRHDGRVWGEAEVDQGATFRFVLAAEK
jgi:PAS domain S-box-containing protein